MRILAISDIHDEYKEAERILSQEKTYDVVLICGDITTHGTPSDAIEIVKNMQNHGKPVLAIAGNMDSPEINDMLIRMECSIDGKGIIIEEVGFFGTSAGPISPLHTPYEIPEEDIFLRSEKGWKDIKCARWKVFVPHAPPFNTKLDRIHSGKHVGSTGIRNFIEKYKPDAVVCGHIHESSGIDILGSSQMINCGPAFKGFYGIIEINESISLKNYK
jgi:putative phosphoesterase